MLASDTGSSPTDFITSSGAVTFSGAATDTGGAGIDTIQVYNETTLLGTATVNSGSWTLSTTLQPGTYNSLKVVTTDLAGNSTSATNNQVIVVDTTPPTETISTTIITDTGATGTITSGGVTNDNTLGLSGTVSDASGVSSVQVYDGATLLGAATVSSGNWSYTTPALLDGSHSFTAKATDNAGNTTTTSAVTATVDTGGRYDAADRDDQHDDHYGYGHDHHHHQRECDE